MFAASGRGELAKRPPTVKRPRESKIGESGCNLLDQGKFLDIFSILGAKKDY